MDRRVLIYGGVGVLALVVLWLWVRSRSSSAAAEEASGDVFGGATMLFTPPAPLAAPGAGDWSDTAGGVTAGTTQLTTLLQTQEENALQIGQASLLESLAETVMSSMSTGGTWSYSAAFVPGADGSFGLETSLIRGKGEVTSGISGKDVDLYAQLAALPGISEAELNALHGQLFGTPGDAGGSTAPLNLMVAPSPSSRDAYRVVDPPRPVGVQSPATGGAVISSSAAAANASPTYANRARDILSAVLRPGPLAFLFQPSFVETSDSSTR